MKYCGRCDVDKPLCEFGPNRARTDGLNSYCRPCTRSYANERYARDIEASRARGRAQYHKDIEAGRAQRRRWHRDNRESVSARKAAQYQRDPARFLERNQRWREANRDRERETNRRYAKLNRHVFQAAANRRRARLVAATVIPFTAEQLAARWAYYGNLCWLCRAAATATDHVKPLAKGGAHMLCNLRPICKSCNSAKRDRWPLRQAVAA